MEKRQLPGNPGGPPGFGNGDFSVPARFQNLGAVSEPAGLANAGEFRVPGELQGGQGVVSEPARLANPDFAVPADVSNAGNLRQSFQDFSAPFGTSQDFLSFLGKL